MSLNEGYLKFCKTDTERDYVEAVIEHGSGRKAAKALGKAKSSVNEAVKRVKDRASLQGFAPENDMVHVAPDSHFVKGTSTLYKDGEVALQWVKTDKKAEDQFKVMREMIEALKEGLPKESPCALSVSRTDSDLMAIYPLGDPHIGLLSWGEETGMDWDINIATEMYNKAFSSLVDSTPAAKEAVIVNLGDYYHADNVAGRTERSGHDLDVDGRFPKMVRAGIRIMLNMIKVALEKHEVVKVINATGNHDDTMSMALSAFLAEMFADSDRVIIESSPTPFHYFTFGNSLYGVHHGHSTKSASLPLVMATDKPDLWGAARFRHWLTGHIHHDTLKEYSGCVVETFRTLAAKDAYATWHGYRSGQDMKSLVVHKDYGEIGRHIVGIGMIS